MLTASCSAFSASSVRPSSEYQMPRQTRQFVSSSSEPKPMGVGFVEFAEDGEGLLTGLQSLIGTPELGQPEAQVG